MPVLTLPLRTPMTSVRKFCSSDGSNISLFAHNCFILQHELLQQISHSQCQLLHRSLAALINLLLPHVCRFQYCLLNDLTWFVRTFARDLTEKSEKHFARKCSSIQKIFESI